MYFQTNKMDKLKIKEYFDTCASSWDEKMIRSDEVISKILNHAGVHKNSQVLDVACGTGVLFKDYLERGAIVTGIDISQEMVNIARKKYPTIDVICDDVEVHPFSQQFDVVMVYNAFPHFSNPTHLIEVLSKRVKIGGRLSIAHGMSREDIIKCHHKKASHVSIELLEIDELVQLFKPLFDIETVISNDKMYQVVGVKK